jgi:hypothetical protein
MIFKIDMGQIKALDDLFHPSFNNKTDYSTKILPKWLKKILKYIHLLIKVISRVLNEFSEQTSCIFKFNYRYD